MATAQVNGIEIWYDVIGPDDGKPILLISGVGTQSTRWKADFVQQLVDRGYRAIKMDNRDIGLSQKFTEHGIPDFQKVLGDLSAGKTPDIPYTLSDMAADGIALLDHLGIDKAHICGFSMGGMIVQLMAIEHPHKVLSMTSVMSNSGNRGLPRATDEAMAALTRPRPDATVDREGAIQSRIDTDKVIGSPASSPRPTCASARRSAPRLRPISTGPFTPRAFPASTPRSLPRETAGTNSKS